MRISAAATMRARLYGWRFFGGLISAGLCSAVAALFMPKFVGAAPLGQPTAAKTSMPVRINYLTLFNATFGRGVTLQNNAAIPLLLLGRPDSYELNDLKVENNKGYLVRLPESRARLCRAMGLPKGELRGPYYVSFTMFTYLMKEGRLSLAPRKMGFFPRLPYSIRNRFMRRPWGEKANPWLAVWLSSSNKALGTVVEASRRPEFFVPMVPGQPDGGIISGMINDLSLFALVRDMATWLLSRAMLELHRGQIGQCERDLLAVHRLGALVSHEHTLVATLVGDSICIWACIADVALANSGKLSKSDAAGYLKRMRNLPRMAPLAIMENTTSRWLLLEAIEEARTSRRLISSPNSELILPAQAANWKAADFQVATRRISSLVDKVVAVFKIKNQRSRAESLHAIISRWAKSRDFLVRGLARNLRQRQLALTAVAQQSVYQRLAYLSLAIAAYRRDHGTFPASLNRLVPHYLRHLPQDPFTGKAFAFSISQPGCRLSSPGHFSEAVLSDVKKRGFRPIVVQLHSPS